MGRMSNIIGVIGTTLRLGLAGIYIKNNSNVVEMRNAADDGYVVTRGAVPTAANDYVTKAYADALQKPLIVKRQADCTAALPTNTGVAGYVLVTTAGTGAVVGDLLVDDGTSSGDMTISAALEGRSIAVTDALAGGTITADADSLYVWDADGSVWIKVGDLTTVQNAICVVRVVTGTSATYSSTKLIPANSRILKVSLEVGTPYSASATISIGYSGTVDAVMTTAQNVPQTAATYEIGQDTAWDSSAAAVLVTISDTPAAGAGVVIIEYSSVAV